MRGMLVIVTQRYHLSYYKDSLRFVLEKFFVFVTLKIYTFLKPDGENRAHANFVTSYPPAGLFFSPTIESCGTSLYSYKSLTLSKS